MTRRKGNPTWTKGGPSPNPSGKRKTPADEAKQRIDTFVELATGYGIAGTDPAASATHLTATVDPSEGLDLWRGSDVGARIVETLPAEALRAGFELELDDDELTKDIVDEWSDLRVMFHLKECLNYSRAAGFRALFLDTDDPGQLSEPLDPARVRSFRSLTQLDHDELRPVSYYSGLNSGKFGEVETYALTPRAPAGTTVSMLPVIHESRLIVFRGPVIGRISEQRLPGIGDSIFVRCKQVIANHDLTWASVVRLVQDCSLLVLKMSGLVDAFASKDAHQIIAARLKAMSVGRSHARTLIIDTAEEMERVNASLQQLPEVIDQLNTRLAMAADLPVTRLLGISPKGMNATGEADRAFLQDRVAPYRDESVIPALERIVELQLAARRQEPEEWKLTGKPLWQLSDKEIAERNKIQSEADKNYYDMGALTATEISMSRFGSGGYSLSTSLDMESREEDGSLPAGEPSPEEQLALAKAEALVAPKPVKDEREDCARPIRGKEGKFAGCGGGGGGGGGGAAGSESLRMAAIEEQEEIAALNARQSGDDLDAARAAARARAEDSFRAMDDTLASGDIHTLDDAKGKNQAFHEAREQFVGDLSAAHDNLHGASLEASTRVAELERAHAAALQSSRQYDESPDSAILADVGFDTSHAASVDQALAHVTRASDIDAEGFDYAARASAVPEIQVSESGFFLQNRRAASAAVDDLGRRAETAQVALEGVHEALVTVHALKPRLKELSKLENAAVAAAEGADPARLIDKTLRRQYEAGDTKAFEASLEQGRAFQQSDLAQRYRRAETGADAYLTLESAARNRARVVQSTREAMDLVLEHIRGVERNLGQLSQVTGRATKPRYTPAKATK